jgi:hypothetical protein
VPTAVHAGFVVGYAESIQTAFLIAVPIAALAFLACWLVPQVELKEWTQASFAAAQQADTQVTQETLEPEDAGRTES